MESRLVAPIIKEVAAAYHGTTGPRADQYCRDQEIPASTGSGNWLGDGSYFWQNSYQRAMLWAFDRYPKDPAVVKTKIRLGRCADLFDPKWVPVLESAHDELAKWCAKTGRRLPRNRGRHHNLDCTLVNRICETKYIVDTVRAPFRDGKRLFPYSLFRDMTHIQLVVRNPAQIIGIITKVYPGNVPPQLLTPRR
jgi:hypothetical protein